MKSVDRFIIDLILLPFSYLYIAILLKLASYLKNTEKMSGETSRKFIHLTVGLIVIAMPIMFSSKLVPVIIGISFIFINFFTSPASPFDRFKLDSISDGHPLGTTYYAISLTALLWFYFDDPWILQAGFLPLVVGDATAAYVGIKYGNRKWKVFSSKSIEGSIGAFLATFLVLEAVLILYKVLNYFDQSYLFMLLLVFMISIVTMIAELISPIGLDNLTIPIFCTAIALFLI